MLTLQNRSRKGLLIKWAENLMREAICIKLSCDTLFPLTLIMRQACADDWLKMLRKLSKISKLLNLMTIFGIAMRNAVK